MTKYLLIGYKGTLGNEFAQQIPIEELLTADREQLDIANPNQLTAFFNYHKPQVVINCAAYTNVDAAETDYDNALRINAEAVQNLVKACNEHGAKLVHFSTGMVFPGTDQNGYNEDDPTEPINRYGVSKLTGEKIILNDCQNFYIIRTEWLYGKPQSADAKKSFVELMIELGKSGKVKGVMDEVGKPTWAKDLAEATLSLITSNPNNGIYHLVNEGQASRLDWAQEIYNLQNMNVEVEPVSGNSFPRPAPRPPFELLNNTKLPKLRTWQEALKEYLNS